MASNRYLVAGSISGEIETFAFVVKAPNTDEARGRYLSEVKKRIPEHRLLDIAREDRPMPIQFILKLEGSVKLIDSRAFSFYEELDK